MDSLKIIEIKKRIRKLKKLPRLLRGSFFVTLQCAMDV